MHGTAQLRAGTAHERIIDALTAYGSRGDHAGRSWQCPAHDDSAPSLSVARGSKGAVLHCHAGCTTEDIVAALGLTLPDLFDEPMEEKRDRPQVVAEYPYCDEGGELLLLVRRYEPGYNGERKTFRQYGPDGSPGVRGIRRVLYRLPEVVAAAQAGGTVLVVEGEKDADALAALGCVATCNIGGAGKWRDDYTAALVGAGEVVVIADRDEPGRKHAAQVAASLGRAGIPHRVVEPAKGKDASDHLAAGLGYDDLVPVDVRATVPTQPGPAAAETLQETEEGPATLRGHLPETFWNSRPVFRHIRQAAHCRCVSADAVLWSTLTRLSGMISYHIRAETGIGGRASLNLFAAIVGGSGTGKSSAVQAAQDLLPVPTGLDFRDGLPLGSGEGMAEVYMGTVDEPTGEVIKAGPRRGEPVTKPVRTQVRHNAFFYVDEGETLTKLMDRSGATIGEAIRRAAVGETLGQTNADVQKSRYVPAGSYSMGLLIGYQPETAMPLLADAVAGTPQRLFWAPAVDPTIPDEPVPHPGPLPMHPGDKNPGKPLNITFPDHIRTELRRAHIARARGEATAQQLDSHEPLMRVKVAAVLALLDSREHVTNEDWELSRVLWECSSALRDGLILRAERQRMEEERAQEERAITRAAKLHQATTGLDRSTERIARLLARKVHEAGGAAVTRKTLRERTAARDRQHLSAALEYAEARGWIAEEGGRYLPGDSSPTS